MALNEAVTAKQAPWMAHVVPLMEGLQEQPGPLLAQPGEGAFGWVPGSVPIT